MEFDHNPHASTGIKLIGASEELIETLEDNQVRATKLCFGGQATFRHAVIFLVYLSISLILFSSPLLSMCTMLAIQPLMMLPLFLHKFFGT